jgi:glycosyltransferase involved in cell wall biosynthesis
MRGALQHAETIGSAPIDILAVGHAPILQINRRLYRALARIGWSVELVIPARMPVTISDVRVQPDDPADPPIHRLPLKGDYIRTWEFEGLISLLDARRPRIVYLENEPDSAMAWRIGNWCVKNGGKLIVNTNENDIPPVFQALRRRGVKPALRSLRTRIWVVATRPRIAQVVAICEDGRQAMQSIGFGHKVSVAPLGFDRTLFRPDEDRRAAIRSKLGLTVPVIAYFGRLAPNKGVHLLIAALSRMKDSAWQFLIDDLSQSSADYAKTLLRCIEETGIADRTISFSATHDEMPDYMRAADIVVVPSTWKEQYGRVAPEAMACGCAVIVSDIGALPELVGSAGVRVPQGDVDALATALMQLVADPARRRELGAAAVDRAHNLLSIDRQAALLDQLCMKLIGAHEHP